MSERLLIPNSYQTPNWLVDTVMRLLTGNEWKCLDVICRKTFGWNKRSDRIAKSQIMDLTGLGETAVDACMAALVGFGLVVRVSENNVANQGVEWSVQADDDKIGWDALMRRQDAIDASSGKRAAKAREAKSAGGGVDGQPHLDGQPGGGVDGQPPQNTLSKPSDVDDKATAGAIFAAYESEIGALTSRIRDEINSLLDEDHVAPAWIIEAIHLAAEHNARNLAYVKACVTNWRTRGKGAPKPGGNHANKKATPARKTGKTDSRPGAQPLDDAARANAERINAKRKAEQANRLAGGHGG